MEDTAVTKVSNISDLGEIQVKYKEPVVEKYSVTYRGSTDAVRRYLTALAVCCS